MIAILLVSLLQLSTAAILRQPYSKLLELDDPLDSMVFELPDDAGGEMLDNDISNIEDHLIVPLLHLAKKSGLNKKIQKELPEEALPSFKLRLKFAISPLQTVRVNLKKAGTDFPMEDIEKSYQDLKKLEHMILPNVEQLLNAIHQGLSHSKEFSQGLLNVLSRHPIPGKVTTPEEMIYKIKSPKTEAPVHEKKPIITKTYIPKFGPLQSKTQILESVRPKYPPPVEQQVVYEFIPLVTEAPDHEKTPLLSKVQVHEIGPLGSKNQIHENNQSSHPLPDKEDVIYEFVPLVTEDSVHEKKPLVTKIQAHEPVTTKTQVGGSKLLGIKPSAHEIELSIRKPSVFEARPHPTEAPSSTEAAKDANQEEKRVDFKDEQFKSENIKDGNEMNSYHSRWTWKTANFV